MSRPSRNDPTALADAAGWIGLAFGLLFAAFVFAQVLSEPVYEAAATAPEQIAALEETASTLGSIEEIASDGPRDSLTGPADDGVIAAGSPDVMPAPLPALDVSAGRLRSGQTLSAALQSKGISASMVHTIATGMRPVFDFRYSRPGDEYWLGRHPDGEFMEFRYTRSNVQRYVLRNVEGELVAQAYQPEVELRPARLAGVVQTSLYEAMRQLGEESELAHDFAKIFAWDVDFSRNVQPGDEFQVYYERRVLVEGGRQDYLGPGRILAARYSNADDDYAAIYFETEEDRGGYYRLDGSSVERQFLRAPLNYRRISSNYTSSRLHPVLKVRRPHPAIDYAAPTGTPVWSVGNGTVIHVGRLGGLGKTVKVRHANGYVSFYGHLSRYPNGLSVGDRVRQKQVVGYVGSTGVATGPHLDFRMQQGGKYINPASVQAPPGEPISPSKMAAFLAERDTYLDALDQAQIRVLTQEAGL